VTLTLRSDGCRLVLPVRSRDPRDEGLAAFAAPECARAPEWTPLAKGESSRHSESEPESGELVSRMRSGYDATGRVALARCEPIGLEGGDGAEIRTRIHRDDPLRARASMAQRTELRRGAWSVAVETEVEISCTKTEFRVEARLSADEAERPVFERRWDERVPREGL
jgi:hypothetical protein